MSHTFLTNCVHCFVLRLKNLKKYDECQLVLLVSILYIIAFKFVYFISDYFRSVK